MCVRSQRANPIVVAPIHVGRQRLAKFGGFLGSFLGPVGTAIGAGAGAIIGGIGGALFGGRAGDAIATETAEAVQGIQHLDSQDLMNRINAEVQATKIEDVENVGDEQQLIDDLKFIEDFNEKYKNGVPNFGIAGVRLRNYRENLARAEIAVRNIQGLSAADMSAAGISEGQQTVITNATSQIENKYGSSDAEGGGFDYIKEHSIEPNYGGI